MRTNSLLQETVGELASNGKKPEDVQWVQWEAGGASWGEFAALADFEYDDGYGGAEVNQSLKIVGDDWWLERHEYDGSEWWEFKRKPERPAFTVLRLEDLKER